MHKAVAWVGQCLLRKHILPSFFFACLWVCCSVSSVFARSFSSVHGFVGPKTYYLALGDSLAFGYQPDLDFHNGYASVLFRTLQREHVQGMTNMGCPGETSSSFIEGGCSHPYLRKYAYVGAQLDAAVRFLRTFRGQVSPVTLDIGANDLLDDIDTRTCTVDLPKFERTLITLDHNLTQVILPRLQAALLLSGKRTGDLVMMNFYDPFQNECPNTVPYVQIFNRHLASDIRGYGQIVDVFGAFGGATTPNERLCSYTWMCSRFHDVHARTEGYAIIAHTFESRLSF